jgi:hypothetical protein
MLKSRRVRWAEYGEKRNAYRVLVGKPKGKTTRKTYLLVIVERIILRWILEK